MGPLLPEHEADVAVVRGEEEVHDVIFAAPPQHRGVSRLGERQRKRKERQCLCTMQSVPGGASTMLLRMVSPPRPGTVGSGTHRRRRSLPASFQPAPPTLHSQGDLIRCRPLPLPAPTPLPRPPTPCTMSREKVRGGSDGAEAREEAAAAAAGGGRAG